MKKILSILATISLAATSGSAVIACAKNGDPGIAFVVSTYDNAYFQNMMKAGKSYATTKGYKLNTYDSQREAAKDNQNVQDAITKGDKAIIINANNVSSNLAILPALNADIPVLNIDTVYAESAGDRGAGAFVSEQTNASDQMFDDVYYQIYGELPTDSNTDQKVTVYAMWSDQANDAERQRFQGFVLNNQAWITIVNSPNSGSFIQGSQSGANSGDAAGQKLADEWASADASAKGAQVIWSGNDPMAFGMYSRMANGTNAEMKNWFNQVDADGHHAGLIVGFDGSDDVSKEVAKWSTTDRAHIFATVKQEYKAIIEAAIDEAIELIEAKEAGTNPPKNFTDKTEIEATVILPEGVTSQK